MLQAESIAQSAERGGLKVAQVEWAGGRNATIQGPTIDFQSFFSGRGVATNFIGHAGEPLFDDAPFITAFGLQFDHPGRLRRPGAVPRRRADRRDRLDRRPAASYSPAKEMRLRVLDFGVDKYGLNAYIFDSTQRRQDELRQGAVLARRRAAPTPSASSRKGEWADVKVTIIGGALDGQTAGMLVKVEELTGDLSRVRLFHTSVSRAHRQLADAGPASPASPATSPSSWRRSSRPRRPPTSPILEAGVTSEETYVEQGLYWSTGHRPMLEYVVKTYQPDLLLAGMPTTDEFQHQFLGLVSHEAAGRRAEPGLRRRRPERRPGRPRGRARGRSSAPRTRRPTRR